MLKANQANETLCPTQQGEEEEGKKNKDKAKRTEANQAFQCENPGSL